MAGLSHRNPTGAPAVVAPVSAADEIVKLAALRDAGAITAEEFTAHKAKLLE